MSVLRFIQGLMWARRESIGGHSPVGGPQMDTGVISLRVAPTATTGAGDQTAMQSIPDSADAQANKGELLGVVARLQGFDGAAWDRIRALDSSVDAQAPSVGNLAAAGFGHVWWGDGTWHRHRGAAPSFMGNASASGAALVTGPGQVSAFHAPAANTQATIAVPAPGGGTLTVVTGITISCAAVAAQGPLEFVLRAGASGVGPIVWQATLGGLAGTTQTLALTGLSIVVSGNVATTLETIGAPAATNLARVSIQSFTVF